MTALAYLATRAATVHLVGLEGAGLWCLLASAIAQQNGQAVVDADQFPYEDDAAWAARLFITRKSGAPETSALLQR